MVRSALAFWVRGRKKKKKKSTLYQKALLCVLGFFLFRFCFPNGFLSRRFEQLVGKKKWFDLRGWIWSLMSLMWTIGPENFPMLLYVNLWFALREILKISHIINYPICLMLLLLFFFFFFLVLLELLLLFFLHTSEWIIHGPTWSIQ